MITIKNTIKLAFAITAISAASTSFSNEYVGVKISQLDLKNNENRFDDVSPTTVNVLLGRKFNDNISAEVRLGIGVEGDTSDSGDRSEIDNSLGYYIKAGSHLRENIYPYIVFGRTEATFEQDDIRAEIQDTSYGIGVDFHLSNSTITVEYMRYMEIGSVDVSGFSFGFNTKF